MLIQFSKNLIPAPNMGEKYNQHLEPHGWYFCPLSAPFVLGDSIKECFKPNIINVITGTIELGNCLEIELTENESIANWKFNLSEKYKAKGKRLTLKLLREGYFSILVKRRDCYLEGVILSVVNKR